MTEKTEDTRPPLPLDEVAQAVLELTSERTLEGFATRFLETVRRWAAPSAVLAAVRDPAAESGWRLLPALCAGSGPLGAERSVRQLVEELPEDLTRASLVRPTPEVPGVKVRENCLVPWSCEGDSGVLVLRGVTPVHPPNLADAVALLSAPLWPRILGGPASRVESSVAELRRLAERLRDDADRQIERLQASGPPAAEPPAPDPAAASKLAGLEQQLAATRGEVDRLNALVGSLRSGHASLSARLQEEQRATADAKAAARAAEENRAAARAAEDGLAAANGEVNRLSALVESLRAEHAGVSARLQEEQRAAADARAAARAAEEGLATARAAEDGLAASRGEVDRLGALVESLRSDHTGTAARLQEQQQAAADAQATARAADEREAAARKELGEAEASVARLILEREELRQQVTTLEKALGETEEERDEFHQEATRLEKRLHALGVARPAGADAVAEGAAAPAPFSGESVEALRRALAVMRRTPFLPPPLRVAAQEAEAVAGAGEKREEGKARIVILDRDTPALEPLAGQLESAGLDVKIASHPEEIALLLKTPDGRDLDAAICDVLAFRPDQNVAGIFRGWQKDRPGLALYLSFSRDSSPEVDRAQRVPLSLTKGRFQRPLNWTELMEMLEPLRRPTA